MSHNWILPKYPLFKAVKKVSAFVLVLVVVLKVNIKQNKTKQVYKIKNWFKRDFKLV